MQQFSKQVVKGDTTYVINAYKATSGLSILAGLVKLLGVPLATVFAGGKKQVEDVLPVAVQALASRLDEDDVVALVIRMLSTTTVQGETLDKKFDLHFQGRMGHLFGLLVEVVKFQYEDFLSVAISAGLREMVSPQASNPPNISNG